MRKISLIIFLSLYASFGFAKGGAIGSDYPKAASGFVPLEYPIKKPRIAVLDRECLAFVKAEIREIISSIAKEDRFLGYDENDPRRVSKIEDSSRYGIGYTFNDSFFAQIFFEHVDVCWNYLETLPDNSEVVFVVGADNNAYRQGEMPSPLKKEFQLSFTGMGVKEAVASLLDQYNSYAIKDGGDTDLVSRDGKINHNPNGQRALFLCEDGEGTRKFVEALITNVVVLQTGMAYLKSAAPVMAIGVAGRATYLSSRLPSLVTWAAVSSNIMYTPDLINLVRNVINTQAYIANSRNIYIRTADKAITEFKEDYAAARLDMEQFPCVSSRYNGINPLATRCFTTCHDNGRTYNTNPTEQFDRNQSDYMNEVVFKPVLGKNMCVDKDKFILREVITGESQVGWRVGNPVLTTHAGWEEIKKKINSEIINNPNAKGCKSGLNSIDIYVGYPKYKITTLEPTAAGIYDAKPVLKIDRENKVAPPPPNSRNVPPLSLPSAIPSSSSQSKVAVVLGTIGVVALSIIVYFSGGWAMQSAPAGMIMTPSNMRRPNNDRA